MLLDKCCVCLTPVEHLSPHGTRATLSFLCSDCVGPCCCGGTTHFRAAVMGVGTAQVSCLPLVPEGIAMENLCCCSFQHHPQHCRVTAVTGPHP